MIREDTVVFLAVLSTGDRRVRLRLVGSAHVTSYTRIRPLLFSRGIPVHETFICVLFDVTFTQPGGSDGSGIIKIQTV
jgi:hypothetical protein